MTFDEAVASVYLSDDSKTNTIKLMEDIASNEMLMKRLKRIAAFTIMQMLKDEDPIDAVFATAASTFTLGVTVGQRMMTSDKEAHA
jgi:ASC-1-like (ASCH) protein